jgi:hypothetical protein
MKFTEKENKYIQKLIQRLEKDNKYWPWLRWLILFASIVSMSAAIYTFYMLHIFQETLSSVLSIPQKEYNSKLIKILIEGNMVNLRLEFILMYKIALQEILGIGLFIYCLKNWNSHIKKAIMIKIIREVTSEKEHKN